MHSSIATQLSLKILYKMCPYICKCFGFQKIQPAFRIFRLCLFMLCWEHACMTNMTPRLFLLFQDEKISTILKAANVDIEPYWPGLFAKALEGINVKDLITNIGSGVGAGGAAAPAAAAAGAAPAAAEKKEEKKEEEPEESDDDMGFGKFCAISFRLRSRTNRCSPFLCLQVCSVRFFVLIGMLQRGSAGLYPVRFPRGGIFIRTVLMYKCTNKN